MEEQFDEQEESHHDKFHAKCSDTDTRWVEKERSSHKRSILYRTMKAMSHALVTLTSLQLAIGYLL